jgi:hypothetical protein
LSALIIFFLDALCLGLAMFSSPKRLGNRY